MDFNSSLWSSVLLIFLHQGQNSTLSKSPLCVCSCASINDIYTNSGYQVFGGMPALDYCSSSCCNTHFVQSVKADHEPEGMVTLTLSIFLTSLVGVAACYVSVICIAETDTGLPTDLLYFNLNCCSNISASTNTHADIG